MRGHDYKMRCLGMGVFGICIAIFYWVLIWASLRNASSYSEGFVYGGMAVGFTFSYWVIWDMMFSGNTEAMSVARSEKLFDKAMYVAIHTHSSIYLKDYPLSFFKKHGFKEINVNWACHTDSPPTVTFGLDKTYWLEEYGPLCYLTVRSKNIPIEIAPGWLTKTSEFKKEVEKNRNIVQENLQKKKAIEEERMKNLKHDDIRCDEKVLEILKAAG